MEYATSDVYDAEPDAALVCETQFRSFGRKRAFHGPCMTFKVYEDHRAAKELFGTPGLGRVLVIDGGASPRVGLMGDSMADLAMRNGWAGVIVHGAIRDSEAIDALDFGVKALYTTARRAEVRAECQENVPVEIGGVTFKTGDWVYADVDAVLVRATAFG